MFENSWAPFFYWKSEEEGVPAPERKHDDDSGFDVRAWKFVKAVQVQAYQEFEVLPDPETGLLPGMQSTPDALILNPGERVLISTGLYACVGDAQGGVPPWMTFDISVCSRSGTPYKEGLVVANQPGTVDRSYRGLIMVSMINVGKQARTIKKGDRIAQLLVRPIVLSQLKKVSELPPPATGRGAGGFGSTGKD